MGKWTPLIIIGGLIAAAFIFGRNLLDKGLRAYPSGAVVEGAPLSQDLVEQFGVPFTPLAQEQIINLTKIPDPSGEGVQVIGLSSVGAPVVTATGGSINYAVSQFVAPSNLSNLEKTKFCQTTGNPVLARSVGLYLPTGDECLSPL